MVQDLSRNPVVRSYYLPEYLFDVSRLGRAASIGAKGEMGPVLSGGELRYSGSCKSKGLQFSSWTYSGHMDVCSRGMILFYLE